MITDFSGNNVVDVGRGDDTLTVSDGQGGGYLGPGTAATPGSGDTVISEAGRDFTNLDELDSLRYTSPRTRHVVLDNSNAAVVDAVPGFVE
ncbi:MAG: hypothetical protein JWM57_1583 [Phycisphaerales bacterium]|nr:hypothetical protein [Phycisphaerales bacterium]